MRADKPDGNKKEIVTDLRARGYHVVIAKGLPYDLTVTGYHRHYNIALVIYVEIKMPGEEKNFTPREMRFQAELADLSYMGAYCVATCVENVRGCFGDYD